MSGLTGGVAPILLASVPVVVPMLDGLGHLQWVSVSLVSLGLLGMGLRELIGGDDGAAEEVSADDDFLGDDLGGSLDDDFDGFDDGLGEDDDPLAEVEPRLDDFEAELADLASTVTAVRGEHESMRESVDEIEENVRKLLEVYEVVTQGANPFVDTSPEAAPSGGGGFGLLDSGAGTSGGGDGTDGPDDLFGADTEAGSGVDADDAGPSTAADDLFEAAEAVEAEGAEEGLTFEDLKSEFEVGAGPDEPVAEPPDEPFDDEPDVAGAAAARNSTTDQPRDGAERASDGAGRGAKPYLTDLPGGFGAELLLMEWLHFLVSESSVADAMRAIRYYQAVEWIGEGVATHLQTVLSGTAPVPTRAATDGGIPTELSVDHHTRSLEYIARLQGLNAEGDRRPPMGGRDRRPWRGDRGVQR